MAFGSVHWHGALFSTGIGHSGRRCLTVVQWTFSVYAAVHTLSLLKSRDMVYRDAHHGMDSFVHLYILD